MSTPTFQFHYDKDADILWIGETGQEYSHSKDILDGKIICDFNKGGQFTGLEIHNPTTGLLADALSGITISRAKMPSLDNNQ